MPFLNHLGTAPVASLLVRDGMKFVGIVGLLELLLPLLEPQASSIVPMSAVDASTRDAPAPVESFSKNSGFNKLSEGSLQPKWRRAEGTQLLSINVASGERIVFGGVRTGRKEKSIKLDIRLLQCSLFSNESLHK